MKELSKRTAGFTDSAIRRMTRVSNKYGAINLSQGFPDFDPPQAITQRLKDIALDGPHQYAVTWGAQNFRDALAVKASHFMGIPIDADKNITVTCGSTEAMMAAMMTVVDPGDKVAIFSPFYENYTADTILCGAEPVHIPLTPPDFSFDPELVEDAFRNGCKALVLCNPSNPTGKVFTMEELTVLADIVKRYDGYVITDEVYEHIIYSPNIHTYMAALPDMFERTVSCNSLSKTYSITGWRLGYVIANEEVTERVRKVHDFLTVGAAAPLMEAAVAGLTLPYSYYDGLAQYYSHLKEVFVGGLKNLGLSYTDPQGAYYVLLDVSKYNVTDDERFCVWMAQNVGVGAVPGSCFFREDVNHLIRLHFAKKEETLKAALERMSDFDKKAQGYREW